MALPQTEYCKPNNTQVVIKDVYPNSNLRIVLGTTPALPSAVGSGAIRYSTTSEGTLQYLNGVSWKNL